MANKKIIELPLKASVTDDLNFAADNPTQTWRVTAEQLLDYILAAGNVGTPELADLAVTSDKLDANAVTDEKTDFTGITVQRFTSGTTYTTPTGCKRLRVKIFGAGGGGAGSGASAGNGGNGGTTTFGSTLASVPGGSGGSVGGAGHGGGAGGAAPTINSPAIEVFKIQGGQGGANNGSYNQATQYSAGGFGGQPFCGGAAQAGGAQGPNTACGGAGGTSGATSVVNGNGGGAGAYAEFILNSVGSSYAMSFGSAGSAGSAGTGGNAGQAGGAAMIIVEEYYQ